MQARCLAIIQTALSKQRRDHMCSMYILCYSVIVIYLFMYLFMCILLEFINLFCFEFSEWPIRNL